MGGVILSPLGVLSFLGSQRRTSSICEMNFILTDSPLEYTKVAPNLERFEWFIYG